MDEPGYLRWIIEGVMGVVLTISCFSMTRLFKRMDKQDDKMDAMVTIQNQCELNHAKLEMEVTRNYVAKADFAQSMGRVFDGMKEMRTEIREDMKALNESIHALFSNRQDRQ